MPVDVDDSSQAPLTAQLEHWAREHISADAAVRDVSAMPGNSGVSSGFSVHVTGETIRRFVIRMAPVGVARRGNTDVLRQVPLLRCLEDQGIPVASLVWFTDDPRWFGTDVIIQDWVDGRPLHMTDSSGSVMSALTDETLVLHAVDTLTDVHRVDWSALLDDWAVVETVDVGVSRWLRVLRAAPHEDIAHHGEQLASSLLTRRPEDVRVGLYHGDYQTNNVLYDVDGKVKAVVDWEIAGIGSMAVDLGWLSIMTDSSCWGPEHAMKMLVTVGPETIRTRYTRSIPLSSSDFQWFRAYAAFSYASIASYNLRLHRTGKRRDPIYEDVASSIPTLIDFGLTAIS